MTVPTTWRSVLSLLDQPLPPDRSPETAEGGPVSVNLPLPLVRQSVQAREHWPIPTEVLEQYRLHRPTPMWRAHRLERAVGAKVPIYVKYEGGNIAGSHKLNTALAQAYYYREAGVKELVTGTGAGQWGTALAAACAQFDLRCTVFMVGDSLRKKPYRGVLMRLLGAQVHSSPSGLTDVGRRDLDGESSNSLSLAIGEAVQYAAGDDTRAFAIGSGETYSILHQSVIGLESIEQLASAEADVDAVVGCVGAGSNFGGVALPFFAKARDEGRRPPLLLAVESNVTPKLTRGVYAYERTDASGAGPLEAMYTIGSTCTVPDSHAAGLRYHGVAKLLSAMRAHGQIAAAAIGQETALRACRDFALTESTLAAPESGHALAAAIALATGTVRDGEVEHRARKGVLVCLSGHGYLDLGAYEQHMDGQLTDTTVAESQLRLATAELPRVQLAGSS
ncbi:MAG: TrpB-like pyridoxal phosphate-dependent enzyme [Stackebrandtia sp.]